MWRRTNRRWSTIWLFSKICGIERSSWTSSEEQACQLQAVTLSTEEMINKICKIKTRLSTSQPRQKIAANSTLREPKRGRQQCTPKSTKWLRVLNFSANSLIEVCWAMSLRLRTNSFKDLQMCSKSQKSLSKGALLKCPNLIKFSVFRRNLPTQTLQNNRLVCWHNKILQKIQSNLDNLMWKCPQTS